MKTNYSERNDVVVRRGTGSVVIVFLLIALLAVNLVKEGFGFGWNKEPEKEYVYIHDQTDNNSNTIYTNTITTKKEDLMINNKMTNSGSRFTEVVRPTSGVTDNYGKEYGNAYVINTWGDPSIYVTVNEEYEYIKGMFMVQENQAEAFNHFVVYAYDEKGNEIYKSQTLYPQNKKGLSVSIPVSGYDVVRIKFSGCDRFYNSVDVICTGLYFSNQS